MGMDRAEPGRQVRGTEFQIKQRLSHDTEGNRDFASCAGGEVEMIWPFKKHHRDKKENLEQKNSRLSVDISQTTQRINELVAEIKKSGGVTGDGDDVQLDG